MVVRIRQGNDHAKKIYFAVIKYNYRFFSEYNETLSTKLMLINKLH